MPYKKNRLQLKREAISRKRSEMGKRGNKVKRDRMAENALEMRVTGTMTTTGIFGDHFIELLVDDYDPLNCWMRVDGEIRRPRTCAGVKRIVGEWIFRKIDRLRVDME